MLLWVLLRLLAHATTKEMMSAALMIQAGTAATTGVSIHWSVSMSDFVGCAPEVIAVVTMSYCN